MLNPSTPTSNKPHKRKVTEGPKFYTALRKIIQRNEPVEEFLRAARLILGSFAHNGQKIEGSRMRSWSFCDHDNGRYIVILYRMDDHIVTMHGIREYSIY